MTVDTLPAQWRFPSAGDIKMIVSDVDGTILDSAHLLPPTSPTHRVLRRIRETRPELPIIISTGKQHRATADLRQQLDLDGVFPCCHLNGNVLYSATGKIVAESGLEKEVVLDVLRRMQELDTSTFIYNYDTVYQLHVGEGDQGWAQKLRGYGETVVQIRGEELPAVIARIESGVMNVIKMAICQDASTIHVPKGVLEIAFPPTAFAQTQALPFCCELIPAAHDKGTALVTLLKYMKSQGYDISPAQVITFGDGENDVSMFQVAGMSVAMDNAMEAPRKAAVWSTGSNDEGGVGTFLERVFWPTVN